MSNDHFVRFENVDKSYDGKQLVVKGLNLDIAEGEFVTIPEREQIPENIKEQLIVELYSK